MILLNITAIKPHSTMLKRVPVDYKTFLTTSLRFNFSPPPSGDMCLVRADVSHGNPKEMWNYDYKNYSKNHKHRALCFPSSH